MNERERNMNPIIVPNGVYIKEIIKTIISTEIISIILLGLLLYKGFWVLITKSISNSVITDKKNFFFLIIFKISSWDLEKSFISFLHRLI